MPRQAKPTKVPVAVCASHFHGSGLLHALLGKQSPLAKYVDVRLLWTDEARLETHRLWGFSALAATDMADRLNPYGKLRTLCKDVALQGGVARERIFQKKYNHAEMADLVSSCGAKALLSATFGGIYNRDLYIQLRGAIWNNHPAGAVEFEPDKNGQVFVPERYRGKEAALSMIEDLDKGTIDGVMVFLHNATPVIDGGVCAGWSKSLIAHLIPDSIGDVGIDEQKLRAAIRMINIQLQTAQAVTNNAYDFLPYFLGISDERPPNSPDREFLKNEVAKQRRIRARKAEQKTSVESA